MKLTPSQALHIQLTSRISRQAETLSALSAEPGALDVLMTTDQFEDDLIEFLQLTGRLDIILENHVDELIANRVLTER